MATGAVFYDGADINKIVAFYSTDTGAAWAGMTKLVNPVGSFTQGVDIRHHKIVGSTITEMTAPEKAARPLPVVDKTQPSGLNHPAVRAATTAALPAHTRTGNVLTASANGAIPAQDGVTLVLQDRLLVKDEGGGTHLENGVYLVTQVGDASNPWILRRVADANSNAEVWACLGVLVEEGTVNSNKFFLLTTPNPITLNTTALTFGPPSISADDITAGTLPVARGGTGQTAKTAAFDALSPVTTRGDLIVRDAANNVRLPIGAANRVLRSDGTDPSWGQVALTTDVTGALPVANGGTGQTTKTAAFDALAPTTTKGDIIVFNGTDNIRLAVGADTHVLTADAAEVSGVKWAAAAGGGNTLTEAYNEGGGGAGRKIVADNGAVIITIDDGALPTVGVNTALVLAQSSAASDRCEVSIIAGASGESTLNFGATDDEDEGFITYYHTTDALTFYAGNGLIKFTVSSGGVIINDDQADLDFRVEGDTLSHMVFTDGTASTENIALLAASAPNWQSMDRGIFIGDMTTAPTGNPTSGIFVWSESGAGKARGGSGTVTTWAPAEPHCPKCGMDYTHEWENEKYEVRRLVVCMNCLTEELGDKPYIIREMAA